jgi:hypothetical protein
VPVAIWLTHAHLDHVLGVSQVRAATGTPVFSIRSIDPLRPRPDQAAAFGLEADLVAPPDRLCTARCCVGGLSFSVRHTGHSPGASRGGGGMVSAATCCLRVDRPNRLAGRQLETPLASIERELQFCLIPPLCTAGGPATTIGAERPPIFLNGVPVA